MSSTIVQDIRVTLRRFARRPGFTITAAGTLAIGIAAISTMLSIVDAVLIRALPYEDPEGLVAVSGTRRTGGELEDWPISYRDFEDWREHAAGFAGWAAYTNPRSFNLTSQAEPEHLQGEMVSAAYFRLLGARPILGRTFSPSEDASPEAAKVAVLSHSLWTTRFASDPGVAGRTLQLNGEGFLVLGVMNRGFRGLTDRADLWIPIVQAHSVLGPHYVENRRFRWLTLLARLEPGFRIEQAQSALDAVTRQLEADHASTNENIGARLTPLSRDLFGDLGSVLWILTGGAVFVLLIACTNVANLLLVQATTRKQDFAIRGALGSRPLGIVRQMLVESLALALLALALGLLLARAAIAALESSGALDLHGFVDLSPDPRVLAAMLAVAVVCGLGLGLVPLRVAVRSDLAEALKVEGDRGAGGAGRALVQRALVIVEITLATTLCLGAALTAKGFQRLLDVDLGFRPEGVLSARVDLLGPQYAPETRKRQLMGELIERLGSGAVPGAAAAAISTPGIPTDDWYGVRFVPEEPNDALEDGTVFVLRHQVSPGYLDTLGISLLRGRDFAISDDESAPPVVIASQAMAQRCWPGQDPIGQRLRLTNDNAEEPNWLTVVGLARDVVHNGRGEARPAPDVYLSILQYPPQSPPTVNFLLRSTAGTGLAKTLEREVRQVAPDLPLYDVATMPGRLERQSVQDRFLVQLMRVFAALALIFAAVGTYSVIAYSVSCRTREIAVRMAMGARRIDVVTRIAGEAVRLAAIGVVSGVAITLVLGRTLESVLHGFSARDPALFATTSLLLLAVALLASYLPARRAARVEPMTSLRSG